MTTVKSTWRINGKKLLYQYHWMLNKLTGIRETCGQLVGLVRDPGIKHLIAGQKKNIEVVDIEEKKPSGFLTLPPSEIILALRTDLSQFVCLILHALAKIVYS